MSRAAFLAAMFAALLALAAPRSALACACCSNEGQRNVDVVALDGSKREALEALRFTDEAKLYVGEADPDSVTGIANPSALYSIKAAWNGNQIVFTLKDEQGHAGTLALELPGKISIFEVDPRDAPDQGTGPSLYKEWKLTGQAAGSGAFGLGGSLKQMLTLIVQGRGNSCTSAGDFAHWTLVMQGPKANYSLFGDLVRAP
jgi:hypothetical protein